MTRYFVTVKVVGLPDFTTSVEAERIGLAKTRAIAVYPHALRGQFVAYDVCKAPLWAPESTLRAVTSAVLGGMTEEDWMLWLTSTDAVN